ncbi:hypothetical protein CUN61_22595 [Pseudomonas arsenicoxydans]|uniref:Uncharacterized protein n=2 Tax=Pseudomonas arsenicoxydans TaxID=702115 RepID=A0A4P6GEY2_9PSED|nr:hypothetical protein CUN61_22595 [Pseudomonas arsenicoxydans]
MMDQFEKASEIAHLSETDIEALYGRYLGGEKNADLLLEYNIDVEPRALLKVLPPIISKDLRCPYCDVPMWAKRRAKTTRESDAPPFKCLHCEHKFFAAGHYGRRIGCACVECFKVKQLAVAAQAQIDRDELGKRYGIVPLPVPCHALGFVQKLGLLALLETCTHPGLERIESLASAPGAERIAPSDEMAEALLRQLFEAGVLVVDLDSTIKAFDRENGFRIRDFNAIRWRVNVTLDNALRSSRQALYVALYEELSEGVKLPWKSELYTLLFDLARKEAIRFIHVLTNEVDFVFTAESRGESVVNQLLQDFSVSEIHYFARLAVKNAAHFYQTGKSKGRSHASNTIPGNMLGTAQDALAKHWRKRAYRDSRVPQSAMHRLLYDVVLKDSGAGFSKSPGIYWRDELVPQFFSGGTFGTDLIGGLQLFCRECDSNNIDVKMDKVMLEMLCYDCATVSKYQAFQDLID